MNPCSIEKTLYIKACINHHETLTARTFHSVTSWILAGFNEINACDISRTIQHTTMGENNNVMYSQRVISSFMPSKAFEDIY